MRDKKNPSIKLMLYKSLHLLLNENDINEEGNEKHKI